MNDWLRKTNFDHVREPCYGSHVGVVRPLARRELIRAALETGEWQVAAEHLHQAQVAQEWLRCGLHSHSEYIATIGISRMHDWRLRLIARTGHVQVGYTYRAALKHARSEQA